MALVHAGRTIFLDLKMIRANLKLDCDYPKDVDFRYLNAIHLLASYQFESTLDF